ncbi:uncharacterized protein PHALS_08294 [Plasmopara halstedii]|uniref:Uncharacterized protein n=1 Tax=Plasmopara halstedii TaxID=4781 RepID=A0A0P1ABC3_PLAHL|nr:uncharacterized protein PHALS_08294 [Plasmopara halstedii]CEG38207.1 hypothetical protein PHALS_08294 [Plasmopara halstedii]|eukprot:XP_024574576.1 hypothetical protein PHALS_08294 [Plasmopara halstedii]
MEAKFDECNKRDLCCLRRLCQSKWVYASETYMGAARCLYIEAKLDHEDLLGLDSRASLLIHASLTWRRFARRNNGRE